MTKSKSPPPAPDARAGAQRSTLTTTPAEFFGAMSELMNSKPGGIFNTAPVPVQPTTITEEKE